MSQTNDIYYSVEPYTGDIICHYKTAGAKWGFTNGKPNGKRKAKQSAGLNNMMYDRSNDIQTITQLKRKLRYSNLNPFAKSNRNKDAKDARWRRMNRNGWNMYEVERDRIAPDGNIYTDRYDPYDYKPGDRVVRKK